MKKIILAIFAFALTSSVMAQNRNETVTFFLNYHCSSCIRVIERNLPHERGVTNFRIDMPGKSIEVTYNPRRTNPNNIRQALQRLGFEVRDRHEDIVNVAPRRCS